jgi:tripartite-type tricarboxylate transporter receptor subunit TctC
MVSAFVNCRALSPLSALSSHRRPAALFTAGIVAAFLGLVTARAAAQDYPNRAVTMMVGTQPGTGTDTLTRLIASQMSVVLGKPVPVENKPGANFALAARLVRQMPPDGYTVMSSVSAMVSNLSGMKNAGYALSDFTVIGGLAFSPYALIVNTKTTGVKSFRELIDKAKANPGKFTYASFGNASLANLLSSRLARVVGIEWREIPFKSGADAALAVSAGTVDAYFGSAATSMMVKDNPSVLVVGITAKERNRNLSDVPTFRELGYDITDDFSHGILVRAGTPQPVVDKLRQAVREAMALPEVMSKIETLVLEIYRGTPEEYAADLRRQAELFESDFRTLGIEPQ